ncbi:MAG: hypothetical protein K8R63_06290 [Bacteroidales bacterium]|nr:hypothetical protein [Bacteroidales bacterium]
MAEQEVNIGELNIRLPERYKETAKDMGQDIVNKLYQRLKGHSPKHSIDSLNFRVNISNEAIPSQITTLITDAILKGLV